MFDRINAAVVTRIFACVLVPASVLSAQTVFAPVQIFNPNWNITLTDAGYSDWLYDNTPGFQGREYLSGEWGAAVSYTRNSAGGAVIVTPTWLEPHFSFPDWPTNSTFTTVNPIIVTGHAFGGLDAMAASTIANSDLSIDLTYEMIDTITGMKMGTSPASATTGSSLDSNRYVLKQTYTITNISGDPITGLHLFQFLHALNGIISLHDNRVYAGPLSDYRYDTTQIAEDANYSGGGGPTFRDYIGFGGKIAPVAFDNGRYGIDDGTDNHGIGKPSVGVHITIENDALANLDLFGPETVAFWVSGAQKYPLGDLAPNASATIDVMLSVRTGTVVQNTGSCSGIANGGSSYPGGVDFTFDNVTQLGDFFAEYEACDAAELAARIAAGEITPPNFTVPGTFQLYEMEYDGAYNGNIALTIGYDPAQLPAGFDETLLTVYQFHNGAWQNLGGEVTPLSHTIGITTTSLGKFALGAGSAPPVNLTITSWRSVRRHNEFDDIAIVLDPTATGNAPVSAGGPAVEPRGTASAGGTGITRVQVVFSDTATAPNPAAISVTGYTTTYPGNVPTLGEPTAYAPSDVAMVDAITMEMTFDPPLPDQSCFVIALEADAVAEGLIDDLDVMVRALNGDANESGTLTISDVLLTKSRFKSGRFDMCADYNLSGSVSNSDVMYCKGRLNAQPYTRSALCP